MSKRMYEAWDLVDFLIVEATIECSNCDKRDIYIDDDGEYFFRKGWRATKDNVYCPECAKEKLKL